MINRLIALAKSPLLRNVLIYALSDGLSRAMPFLVFPIVAYYLSAEQFGLVTNFNVFISVLIPFAVMSSPSILNVDYHRTAKMDQPRLFGNLFYFNVTWFAVTALLVIFFNRQIFRWSGLDFTWQLLALVAVFFNPFVSLFSAKLRMDEKARQFGIYNFVSSAIAAFLTYVFVASLQLSWEGRLYSIVLAAVLAGVFPLFSWAKISDLKKIDFNFQKDFFCFRSRCCLIICRIG